MVFAIGDLVRIKGSAFEGSHEPEDEAVRGKVAVLNDVLLQPGHNDGITCFYARMIDGIETCPDDRELEHYNEADVTVEMVLGEMKGWLEWRAPAGDVHAQILLERVSQVLGQLENED